MKRVILTFLLLLIVIPAAALADDAVDKNPAIEKIDPPYLDFYSKQLVCRGIPIRAHQSVDDLALQIAYRRLERQLAHIPQVVENLNSLGAALHLIGKDQATTDLPEYRHLKGIPYVDCQGKTFKSVDERARGLGGIVSTCAEENLLALPSDRFKYHRDICSHEFAHTIYGYGFSPNVRRLIEKQYEKSMEAGLWPSYAGTNPNEFFAELTMWYFDSRGDYGAIRPSPKEGPEWLKSHDPSAYRLLDRIYSGKIPVAKNRWQQLTKLAPEAEKSSRSLDHSDRVPLIFVNTTDKPYRAVWLDYEGNRQEKSSAFLRPGHPESLDTFATHPWVILDKDENVQGVYIPGKKPCKIVIE